MDRTSLKSVGRVAIVSTPEQHTAFAKVADAYKLDRKVQRTVRPHGAIAFDDRNLSWYTDKEAVSIWTVAERQHISYSLGEHQRTLSPRLVVPPKTPCPPK